MTEEEAQQLDLASSAKSLLGNPAFVKALEQIETDFIMRWRSCRINPVEAPTREGCHQMLYAVARLRGIIEEYVETGLIVTDRIEFFEREQQEKI